MTAIATQPSVRQQVLAYLERTHISKTRLAEITGYSRPAISAYLNDKYDSDTTEIERRLLDCIGRDTTAEAEHAEGEKTAVPAVLSSRGFYVSADAAAIIGVCARCQSDNALGIIVGRTGYGKTYTLKQYARQSDRCAYIECDDTMSSRDLVDAIERVLGIPSGTGGTIWRHVNGIRDYFGANPGYLLIVDEADKLVSKYTSKKMEILRAIYDQTDVGLVIAGEPKLEMQIKSYLARFANRVDFYASLHGLQAGEVADYLKNYDIDEAAMAELKARACNIQNGCFRLLDRTLRNVDRILRERSAQAVTAEVIREASGLMML